MLIEEKSTGASPTPDLSQAMADYARNGYCVVPNVLSPAQVAAARQRIEEQAEAELALGWARLDNGPKQQKKAMEDMVNLLKEDVGEIQGGVNQRISFLVNKGQVLRDLITHPVALGLAEHVLGKEFLLCSFAANIANKGGVLEDLHRDSWWMPVPIHKDDHDYVKVGHRKRNTQLPDSAPKDVVVPPVMCVVVWMLTDFTEENGGTRLVPGSNLRPDNPVSSVPHVVPSIAATGKAGSVVMWDGRLWHATGQNLTDDPRIGLLCAYCGPLIRPHENYFLGLDPAVLDQASDKLLDLLGYSSWFYFNRLDTLSSPKRFRAREPWISELHMGKGQR
jgi:ectoine hydroxylase-related dioxygenase (phytanoyl-CoA dioxygenase family)